MLRKFHIFIIKKKKNPYKGNSLNMSVKFLVTIMIQFIGIKASFQVGKHVSVYRLQFRSKLPQKAKGARQRWVEGAR